MSGARRILGAAAVVLVAGLSTAGCKDVGGLPTEAPDPGAPPAGGGGAGGGGTGSKTVVVEISGFAFRGPSGGDRIELAVGDTLEFVNRDASPHTATTDAFDSGRLDLGERYRTVVSDAGTLALRCDFHPAMTGTVVAAAGSGGPGGSGDPGGSAGDPGGSDDPGGSGGPGGSGDPGAGPGDPGSPGDSGGSGGSTGGGGTNATVVVEVRDDVFVGPDGSSRIAIAPGTTVRFVNRGGSSHTATSTSTPTGGASFDSGRLRPGDSFEASFPATGTWDFRCDFHDGMTGAIVVAEGAGGSAGGGGTPGGSGGGGSPPPTGPGPGGTSTVVITIGDGGFSGGGNAIVSLGQAVEWVNASGDEHELDSTDEPDDAPEIESGDLAPGARYRFVPDRTGVWTYRCKEHDGERGMRIEVR